MAADIPTPIAGNACPDIGALARYAENSAAAEERARVAEHVGKCATCRERVEEMREVEGFLRQIRPREADSASAYAFEPPVVTATDAAAPDLAEHPGSMIGRYTLLEQIGEGGFGVVFSAEQREPVSRRVALKVLKPGMDSRQVLARFEAERHTLAKMDHPNIARVLDAGSTDAGRPYFVMELVEGVAITRFCDEQRLTLRERLGLFRTVCAAVQHAHQKGIIHRDLKPGNVLVALKEGVPVPKVIDFGIAKATDQQLTEQAVFTRLGQFIGTPEYMSPEQASGPGVDIDTRSDVYSLGVLLYELLTGATPLDPENLRRAGLAEIQRIIREGPTPRPSTRLSATGTPEEVAAARRTDVRKLATHLKGDLDWILLKALEKDRARRYETVAALSEDLRRYLESEPVMAGPPSALYRVRKFARRNRRAVIAGAAIAIAVLAGLAAASVGLVQAREAERQRAAEASWANQVASLQASPYLSEALRDQHRAEWAARLDQMRRSGVDKAGLIRQEGLFAVWGWRSYVGASGATLPADLPPPTHSVPEPVYQSQLRRADSALEWGPRVADVCGRARGVLALADPLWVALVHDTIRWKEASKAPASELAAWYDTMVEASDAAYGELSDFSLGMLCERVSALGNAGDFDGGMRALEEYLHRREAAVVTLSDEQYMRHERIVLIYDKHDNTDTYWKFLKVFDQDARNLSEQGPTNYSFYSAQIYGMWLWTYGHYEEADRVLSELLHVMRGPSANALTNVRLVYRIGVCRMWMGKPDLALDLLREAVSTLESRPMQGFQACYIARAKGWLGQCLSDLGQFDEAEPNLLAAHEWHAAHAPEPQDLTEATGRLVQLYERWERPEEADLWRIRLVSGTEPALDEPENLDFERGAEGEIPPGWFMPASLAEAGAVAQLTRDSPVQGEMCVRIPAPPPGATANNLIQDFSALPYRDKRVRVSAKVRVEAPGENDRAQFWMRIDPTELDGFSDLDNSNDRPIRWSSWDRFEMEFDVQGDTARIVLGLLVYGSATAWLDDLHIEVIEPIAAPVR